MGNLVPISVIPTLPGDIIKTDVQAFVRGMPTIAPIMDKVDIKINHFYVPYRVLWDAWQDFLTMDNTLSNIGEAKPSIPKFTTTSQITSKLGDYLGNQTFGNGSFSLMPFLAYQRIFLDYYAPARWVQYLRTNNTNHPLADLDRQLNFIKRQSAYTVGAGTTTFTDVLAKLRNVGWNHDYFTNALPTPQLFDQVNIPIIRPELPNSDKFLMGIDNGAGTGLTATYLDGDAHWSAAINKAKLGTIRNLRENIALQQFLEKMQVGGGRYKETLNVIWGEDVPNATLQRPEYLGGSTIPLFVNEVEAQGSSNYTEGGTTKTTKLGDLGGKPIAAGKFDDIDFKADEHGLYMCLAHIVPKRTYTDVIEKNLWIIDDVYDLPQPDFETIGDEAVYKWEMVAGQYNQNSNQAIFGYVPRYSNWKTKLDRYSGEFRTTLKHWHLGEDPNTLNQFSEISPEFIECNPREDIFNVSSPDKFLATFDFKVIAKRKLQYAPQTGLTRI